MKFGYKRDPIKEDPDFSTKLKPFLVSSKSESDIDLSGFATDTDQYDLSSCAANATADSVEILNAIDEHNLASKEDRTPHILPQLSRLFVYAMARSLMDENNDGNADLDKDEGTFIRLCFEVLSRFGICDEEIWPYDISKVFVSPSIKAMRQAVGHRIHSYYRINQTGADRIPEITASLRAMHPVVFGTLISNDFMNINGPSVVDIPKKGTAGGHAMLIVGYLNGFFKIKNSWGRNWRENGYCYMTPSYISWENTWDIWVPTSGVIFKRK